MEPSQPGKAPGTTQQLYRQVQIMVNEALRMLDAAKPLDQANQSEVESLRAAIWSDLTALEAEFGREEGPRADRLDRFFNHLLSSGDHIGQIEALGGALVGGAPPSKPSPDSPVAGLYSLHGTLSGIRRQWQEISPPVAAQPSPSATTPIGWKNLAADGMGQERSEKPEMREEPPATVQRSPASRATTQPPRRANGSERLLDDLGFSSASPPAIQPQVDALRPRVVLSFVTVFVVLMLLGVGVIYWGLSSSTSDAVGPLPTDVPTLAPGSPQTTMTPNAGPPQLHIIGGPLLDVPCPSAGSNAQFQVSNDGGGVLNWTATVKPQGAVALDMTSGQLSGGLSTSIVIVTVTAVAPSGNGTITIIATNIPGPSGTQSIQYHILPCS